MATVFRALDPRLERHVAIKVLPSFSTEDPSFLDRFTREGQAIARLTHPNIITIHDVGKDKGFTYIVMELVEGGTLRDFLDRRLSVSETVRIVTPLADALDYAHGEGIIHKDLKPSNVLLSTDGKPILSDFGLARILHGSAFVTGGDKVLGTAEYMSPEQVMGRPVDHRSDLYAFGVMVYQMLLGQTPFRGDSASSTMMAHVHQPVPPPRTLDPDADPRLKPILLKALAKDPDDRYQSADDITQALATVMPDPAGLPRAEHEVTIVHSSESAVTSHGTGTPPEGLDERAVAATPGGVSISQARPLAIDDARENTDAGTLPPPAFVGAVAGNLPVELSSFVGRSDEIRTIGELLSASRLVTLVGIGGAGKTRLALRAADEQQEAYPDGVWLVQLASLTDSSLVDREVTATIGPSDRNKRLLLVLDSCEHLLEACAQTALRVLQEAPLGRVLATSREPLGVPGEVIYRVPPLSIPPSTDLTPDSLSTYEAVTLFVARARSVQPSFVLTPATGHAVSQIAVRLDGIPLGIELAAARVNVLSVDEIAKRLGDMFRLLSGGSRTALPQQRTLEAAIEWSYRLLPRPEQLSFNRLSVFRGGFTLEAAEQVAADPDQGPDVLELLSQLVNKSIVTVEQKEGRPTRYRLLETLRQYGWDRLQESDEVTEMRDRHTGFFLDVAKGVEVKLRSTGSAELLTSLKDDQDNLRAAWDWARESNNQQFLESESMGSLLSIVFAL